MKFTGRTRQVWELLSKQDRLSTAMELHHTLRSGGDGIGLITVYRSLRFLVTTGKVDVLRGPDGQQRYRRCSPTAHHHLVCRRCLRVVEVYDSPPGQLSDDRLRELGFANGSIQIKLIGLCGDCSKD